MNAWDHIIGIVGATGCAMAFFPIVFADDPLLALLAFTPSLLCGVFCHAFEHKGTIYQ